MQGQGFINTILSHTLVRLSGILFFSFILLAVTPGKASAIVNGQVVGEGEQPWMVGLAQAQIADGYQAQFCGGTLITSEWVLTAAHCTYNENGVAFAAAELDAIISRHQLSSTQGERIRIDKIVRHDQYQASNFRNDIALLHLSQPSQGTPIHLLTSLPKALAQAKSNAVVAGWGVTATGEATDNLERAELPLVSTETCQTAFAALGFNLTPGTLCAGYAEGGIDACTGDSGGPLIVWDSQTQSWLQIGIVSWGEGCAQRGHFGVYTRVANFTQWIHSIIHIDTGAKPMSSLNVTQGN